MIWSSNIFFGQPTFELLKRVKNSPFYGQPSHFGRFSHHVIGTWLWLEGQIGKSTIITEMKLRLGLPAEHHDLHFTLAPSKLH